EPIYYIRNTQYDMREWFLDYYAIRCALSYIRNTIYEIREV
ncbi:unnamed protein product, partial [marine sediment metagenome]